MPKPGPRWLEPRDGARHIGHRHRGIRNEAAGKARSDRRHLLVRRLGDLQSLGGLEGVHAAHVLQPEDLAVDAGGGHGAHAPLDVGQLRAQRARRTGGRKDRLALRRLLDARIAAALSQPLEKGARLEVGVEIDDQATASPISLYTGMVMPILAKRARISWMLFTNTRCSSTAGQNPRRAAPAISSASLSALSSSGSRHME